jgi:alpha-1,3-rhamnosyl/mannosyltransferase
MVWFYDMDALRSPAGVTRHAVAMRHELARSPGLLSLSLATGRIQDTENLATWETWDDLPRTELPFSTRTMLRYWWLSSWPPITTWTGQTDWIYAPAELAVAKGRAKLAVTSHDIAQDLRWQPPRRKALLDRLFQTADKVFSVSPFNTSELLNAYPHLEGRVTLVPNAADEVFNTPASDQEKAGVRRELGLTNQKPYLLSVANFQPRKNLESLIRAAAMVPEVARGEMALVLIGEGSEDQTRRLQQTIEALKNPKVQIQIAGYVQGVTLRAAYASAAALVFPSLCESFGIPVLEAISQGCPVALANTTGLPDVAKDSGWYFDPNSEESITATISELLADSTLREDRVADGHRIASEYRWSRSAKMVMDSLSG